ncbi:TonB-dependent receptor [Marilutibacter maris]|uniref:TonB-dependent receptor n=1 Tax=Marilutibacter maris TaxID=1605891 RepID=UPI000DA8A8A5|nr:TonB-dependent receptor [Lysobacter maris]
MRFLTLAIVPIMAAGAHAAERVDDGAPASSESATDTSASRYLADPPTLDTITVVGQRLFPYQEGMVLNEGYIDDQVRGNGDIGTLLRINPNVQFDDSAAASSNRMGEIRPSDISINGGLYYQNLFRFDGATFNNDLDPSSDNPHHVADVPSSTQGIALDTELIGRLTVYDSNVPAGFGGFNGGVVDAQSRKAKDGFGGKVSLRMSRSAWNEMILPEGDEDSAGLSSRYTTQPNYDKYRLAAMLEGRTSRGLGWIANVQRTRSDIPLRGYSSGNVSPDDAFIKEQRRQNTSASLRLDWTGERVDLAASLTYAPTDERYFTQNAKNSYFDLKQGGPIASVRMSSGHGAWTLAQTLSHSDMESSRRVEPAVDYWKSWARSSEFDWGVNNSSFEGNWGNVDQRNRTSGYGLTLSREPMRWGGSEHALQLGLQYRDRLGTYHRLNDHYSYLSPSATTTCTTASGTVDTEACSLAPVYASTSGGLVAGQGQYFRTMNVYRAGHFEARVKEWSVFVEDDIRLGRWSLRAGLRVDGDDLMDKTTVAPRLALSWDMFGDRRTLLTAGANRYYGRSFFSYKLREGRENLQTTHTRTADTLEWTPSRQYTANNRFETLDIPYSDELNGGINQRWRGLDINLKYVRRDGHDEVLRQRVASDDDSGYYSSNVYQYVNAGRSRSDTYTLSIGPEKPWAWRGAATHWQFAFDHTDVRRNYSDYESSYTDGSYNRWVRYEGTLIRAYELPQSSYNRPWTARLSSQTRIARWGLLWSNFFRYRAGHTGLATVDTEPYQGEEIDVIRRYELPRTFTWDSTVEYTLPLAGDSEAYVRVEAQNVTNRRNPLSGAPGGVSYYEPGRSYWLELGYRF